MNQSIIPAAPAQALAVTRTREGSTAVTLGGVLLSALVFVLLAAQSSFGRSAPESFADLAEALSPSVVNITTTQVVASREREGSPVVPEGSPFEDLFRNRPQRPERASALGSGFVISEDGYIVTNNHVIEKADQIQIEFFSGKTLDAKLIGRDPKTDIAVLKVESDEPLPFVSFADSDTARVGDWVLAIGNPLGQGFSVSAGIISARNRALRGSYDDYIQTDAAINRGNSGGPLFNMDGSVIGVNTAILSPNGGSIGIGFSMSSNVVKSVVAQLRDFGETRRGWLGVRIQPVDPSMAEALGLETAMGALIAGVSPDGPAEEGGIEAGDVILKFDGQDVEEMRDLPRMVAETEVGKAVRVVVFREGKTQTLKVTLGRLEEGEVPAAEKTSEGAPEDESPARMEILGMMLSRLTPEARDRLNLADDATGVAVLDVGEDSMAFEKGLRGGDLITEVGQTKVTTPQEVDDRVKAATDAGRKSILLLVQREGQPRFVALTLAE